MSEIIIYSDGSCYPNPGGPGGYGAIIDNYHTVKEISQGFRATTNNRMEMMGCIMALVTLGKHKKIVTVYSDSQYVVKGIGWATGWRENNWRTGEGKPAKNVDLWTILLGMNERHDISWRWVRGHAGHTENERCDELAGEAKNCETKFIDLGFEASNEYILSQNADQIKEELGL